jgi:DNA-binding FrmR family transcriptional regulator
MATTPAATTREQLLVRLRRAEGQLRGVQRMLEEDADCREVLTQLSAVKAALDQVGLHLITDQMRTCVAQGEGDCVQQFEDTIATFLRFAALAR